MVQSINTQPYAVCFQFAGRLHKLKPELEIRFPKDILLQKGQAFVYKDFGFYKVNGPQFKEYDHENKLIIFDLFPAARRNIDFLLFCTIETEFKTQHNYDTFYFLENFDKGFSPVELSPTDAPKEVLIN